MNTINLVLSIVLFVIGLFLTAIVAVQSDRGSRMNAVTGGNENGFFDKDKASGKKMFLIRSTIIAAVVFIILIVVINIVEIL